MKRKIIAIITALVLSVSLIACSTNDTNKTDDNTQEQTETVDYVLTDFVSGLKDWTVEVGAENIDFMKDVEYNKEVVKEVTVDDSKVDVSKEGKYDLVYTIVPVDDSISDVAVTKKVTVKVVSVEEAQKEADAGKQVATSNNEVKKDSNGKTPVAPKQDKPAETPAKKPSGSTGSNSNNNSKPSTGNNKPSGSTGDNKPAENKPAGNTGNNSQGGNNNQVNNNNSGNTQPPKEEPPKHEHNFVYVPAVTHTEYKNETTTTQKQKYKWVGYYECNGCHETFENADDMGYHDATECGMGYSSKKKQVPDGYETVTETKKVPYEVVDQEAYYKCSDPKCGATKK